MKKTLGILVLIVVCSLNLMADLNEGLVAHYPFNGNAIDESGNGFNGNIIGATLSTDRFGNDNCAYLFNGIDDGIEVSHNPILSPENSISISCWIKVTSNLNGTLAQIVNKSNYAPARGYYLAINQYMKVKFRIKGMSNEDYILSDNSILQNEWYHLVAIFENNQLRLYVNQIEKDQQTNVSGIYYNVENTLRFAYHATGNLDFFPGKIDDIRIYNRALTETEIQELYDLIPNNIPEITNITFSQRTDGSQIVDINYELYDEEGDTMYVSVFISFDSGTSWEECHNVSGDVGSGQISGSNKQIEWYFGTQFPDTFSEQVKIKITADDGN